MPAELLARLLTLLTPVCGTAYCERRRRVAGDVWLLRYREPGSRRKRSLRLGSDPQLVRQVAELVQLLRPNGPAVEQVVSLGRLLGPAMGSCRRLERRRQVGASSTVGR